MRFANIEAKLTKTLPSSNQDLLANEKKRCSCDFFQTNMLIDKFEAFALYILKQEKYRKFMAFVFNKPRWQPREEIDSPGPGSYFQDKHSLDRSSQSRSPKIKKGMAAPKQHQSIGLNEITNCFQTVPRNNRKPSRKDTYPTKVFKYSKPSENDSGQHGKFIEVSSLTPKLFPAKKTPARLDEVNLEKALMEGDYWMFRTPPSIQKSTSDNFYIGSKGKDFSQEPKTGNCKKNDKVCKGFSLYRSVSAKRQRGAIGNEGSKLEHCIAGSVKKQKKEKPMSAKHPLRKRDDLISAKAKKSCNQSAFTNEGPTKLDQDDDQDDSEFISEAFPGPGQYSPKNHSLSSKKGPVFTEGKQRFTNPSHQFSCRTDFYTVVRPTIKKFSRASQKKVGFGRSVQEQKQNKKNGRFQAYYQDYQTIENKALKDEVQNKIKPGFFQSKQPRFKQDKDKIDQSPLDWKEQLKNKQNLDQKINKNIAKYKKTPCFKSTKPRNMDYGGVLVNSTKNVDYSGQNYKTLQDEITKIKQRVEITQDFNIAFLTSQQRFKEDLEEPKQHKSYVQVKHQLVEDFYGLRKRPDNLQSKGYTFAKANRVQPVKNEMQIAEEDQFQDSKLCTPWIKQSFNKNFAIRRNEQKRFK